VRHTRHICPCIVSVAVAIVSYLYSSQQKRSYKITVNKLLLHCLAWDRQPLPSGRKERAYNWLAEAETVDITVSMEGSGEGSDDSSGTGDGTEM
jgi:hypothetical protein